MAKVSIKVSLDLPRKVAREDWHEVIKEQLTEQIPDTVYYETEDGEEHSISVEVE